MRFLSFGKMVDVEKIFSNVLLKVSVLKEGNEVRLSELSLDKTSALALSLALKEEASKIR